MLPGHRHWRRLPVYDDVITASLSTVVHADSGLRSTARVHDEEPTGPIARRYDICSKCDGISVFVSLCICFKQFV